MTQSIKKPLIGKKSLATSILAGLGAMSASAQAALDQTLVDGIRDAGIADAGVATTAGFAVMTVVLGASVGFSLLGRFIAKGANGG